VSELQIRAVRKQFGNVEVLKAIDLAVANGEFISLLGPSGCGKTTTLRCIAGFEFPTSGQILFDGTDLTHTPPEQRDIGMVFQSYALFPHLTVKENLAFGLEMRDVTEPEKSRRINDVLAMVQLVGFEKRFPRELSGGQQQRVALARALVIEPSVLLLDEPLANLDAALRDDMRFFIRDLQQRVGITAIYVTHDQSEAIVMSDRIVVMFDGEIAQVGPPKEIHDRPVSKRVAEFVGKSNFLKGRVESRGSGGMVTLDTAIGRIEAAAPGSIDTGDTVECLLRPESIRIAPLDDLENRFPARIESVTYLGNAVSVMLSLNGSESVLAFFPADFEACPGDEVEIGFAAANAWCLP
jgi:putative spermidine/putrescine transport system ATP-binding protein